MEIEEEKKKIIDGLKSQIVYLEEEIKLIESCKDEWELLKVLQGVAIRSSHRLTEEGES